MKSIIYLTFVATLISWGPSAFCENPVAEWIKIGDDLEIARASIRTGTFSFTELTLLRTELRRYKVRVVRSEDLGKKATNVRNMCKFSKGIACINANFFDEKHKPLGLVVSRGKKHRSIHRGGKTLSGIFEVNRQGVSIVSRTGFDPAQSIEAIQSGPRLVQDGKPVQGLRDPDRVSRRSGMCIDSKNRLVIYVVSSRLFGISLSQLQDVLLMPSVRCTQALNLDGGGSSQFFLASELPGGNEQAEEIFLQGSDEVPVALALIASEPR